jgi:hypothetical protein
MVAMEGKHGCIGIDPGLRGAVVALDNLGKTVDCFDCPRAKARTGSDFDEHAMADLLIGAMTKLQVRKLIPVVYLEKLQAGMGSRSRRRGPQMGINTAFKMALGYGLWRGIVGSLPVISRLVHPRTWQAEMLREGRKRGKTKEDAAAAVARLIPDLSVLGPLGGYRDGRADAGLIALYGLRNYHPPTEEKP